MKNVECIFYLNGGDLYIVSDEGIYNNVTNDMEFTKNVKVNYLENVLFSERVNFKNEENELMVEGNVISEGPEGKLRADRMDFDLNSKNEGDNEMANQINGEKMFTRFEEPNYLIGIGEKKNIYMEI